MTVKAYAKINLILNVLGKRPDGFHEIETVFYALDLCDLVSVEPAEKDSLCISPLGNALPGVEERDNLAFKALALVKERFGIEECFRIEIEKHIPDAAGFGGGSADAAAVLKALSELCGVPDDGELFGLASRLGSDVPFCLAAILGHRAAIGRGRGEILEYIELPEFEFEFTAGPGMENKTARVYRELCPKDCEKPFNIKAFLAAETPEEKISLMGNQLQSPLERLTGIEVKDRILCGAGPTYFKALPKREHL